MEQIILILALVGCIGLLVWAFTDKKKPFRPIPKVKNFLRGKGLTNDLPLWLDNGLMFVVGIILTVLVLLVIINGLFVVFTRVLFSYETGRVGGLYSVAEFDALPRVWKCNFSFSNFFNVMFCGDIGLLCECIFTIFMLFSGVFFGLFYGLYTIFSKKYKHIRCYKKIWIVFICSVVLCLCFRVGFALFCTFAHY